ncbi:SHOCT domain-containing protein [Sulfuricurvum sp.]|uniref:SHOCT domain-containing protein n=1 Tax=Sulfuricurvum sp. TaxID=2025608 RepID=UPI003C45E3E4
MVDYGMHGWAMGFFWLIPIGLFLVFVYLFKGNKPSPSAREILDRRYAKGEIDTQEYRERLRELGYKHEGEDD